MPRSYDNTQLLFAQSVASNIIGTVREAFAVTATLHEVDVLAVSRKKRWVRRDRLKPLCVLSADRQTMWDPGWTTANPLDSLSLLGPVMALDHESMTFDEVDLSDQPDASAALDALSQELDEEPQSRTEE